MCPSNCVRASGLSLWFSVFVSAVLVTTIHSLHSSLRIDKFGKGSLISTIAPGSRPIRVDLRRAFNFNNNSIYSVWVHRDGFLSLEPPPPSMYGYPLNSSIRSFTALKHKLISVFMARVDASAAAIVRHRLIQRSDPANDCRIANVMRRLEREIHVLFPADKGFRIEQMLVVNWDKLKFDKARDETNTFEAALLTNGFDSFIIFNYIDINWDRPSIQRGWTPDPYPQAGLADKDSAYPLPLNGQVSANKLETSTNVATPGMWVLKTGRLQTKGEFKNPDVKYGREHLQAIRNSLGFGKTGMDPCRPSITSRLKSSAPVKVKRAQRRVTCADDPCPFNCESFSGEVCCTCPRGLNGDGHSCFNLTTQRVYVIGPARFKIGSRRTEGRLLLQATNKGPETSRGYVRFEGDPQAVSIAQLLVPLFITPMWFAAYAKEGGVNAMELSGMRIRRRTDVRIDGFGMFAIEQTVNGLDGNLRGKWDTNVTGRLGRNVDLSGKVSNINLRYVTYKYEHAGLVSTNWKTLVTIGSKPYTVEWTEEINYYPVCPSKPVSKAFTVYTDNLYGMRNRENQIYYMGESNVKGGAIDTDPCAYPKVKCPGEREICVRTGSNTHDCKCEPGFEMVSGKCTDIDECTTRRNDCDINARCENLAPGFRCICNRLYRGNGKQCERIDAICSRCSRDGRCVQKGEEFVCQCKRGFEGDGFSCTRKPIDRCAKCDRLADCINGNCRCKEGLVQRGNSCYDCTLPGIGPKCHENGFCRFYNKGFYYRCECRKGFVGNGTHCNRVVPSICSRCDRNAECVDNRFCRCRAGYRDPNNDGFLCVKECVNKCDLNAKCDMNGRCQCNTDYIGDGISCKFDCQKCHIYADCHPVTGCKCKPFFEGDGRVCTIKDECFRNSDCGPFGQCNAAIVPDNERVTRRICGCERGYERKRGRCEPVSLKLKLTPSRPVEVDEGDHVTFKCEIIEGSARASSLIFYRERSRGFRQGIRKRIYEERGMMELIIYEARPEDSGRYICSGDGTRVDTYLTVKPNPCNRKCHDRAFCDTKSRQCTCMPGNRGDGINSCLPAICSNFPDMCDRNAVCRMNKCHCNKGYNMVGEKCELIPDCRSLKNCHKNADCVNMRGMYKCRCRNGYSGNGRTTCTKIKLGCNHLNRCVKNAECTYMKIFGKYNCRCKEGYFGSGDLKCRRRYDCDKNPLPCGRNSRCVKERRYDDRSRTTVTVGLCKCQPGYRIVNEKCHKISDLNTKIYVSQDSVIYELPVVPTKENQGKIWYSNKVNRYSPIVIAVATDCSQRKVYWSSGYPGPTLISVLEVKGGSKTIIARNTGQVEGLAVDWIAGNIFYTVPRRRDPYIGVVTRDGSRHKVIAKGKMMKPRGIAVDPTNGKVYWTDWDRSNPRIEVSNMDGSERKILIQKLRNLPNGLVYDFNQNRLCWIETDSQTRPPVNSTAIKCLYPNERSPMPRQVFYENDGNPFALTYNDPTFYYTDWQRRQLQSVTNAIRKPVVPSALRVINAKMYGVSIMPDKCPPAKNACSRIDNKYGGCRYLCLPVSNGGKRCVCPEDNKNCTPTV